MTKDEVLEQIEDGSTYRGSQVRHYVNMVTGYSKKPPSVIKRGDVVIHNHNSTKSRPYVILKVVKQGCWGIALSTTKDEMVLSDIKGNSRFFQGNYFSKTLVFMKHSYVQSNFAGVFDDNVSLSKAVKALKELLIKDKVF